jgi:hypothetical protein
MPYDLDAAKAALAGLLRGGLNPVQASGFLGNFMEESSLNPRAYNAKEGAGGLGQWRLDRIDALKNFAAQNGGNWADPTVQGMFAAHEVQTAPRFARVWSQLQSAATPQAAAHAVVGYEAPAGYNMRTGDPTGVPSYQDRVNHAASLYSQLQGGGGVAGMFAPGDPANPAGPGAGQKPLAGSALAQALPGATLPGGAAAIPVEAPPDPISVAALSLGNQFAEQRRAEKEAEQRRRVALFSGPGVAGMFG